MGSAYQHQTKARPVSGVGANSWGGIGQTLVDALDTLWLMDFKEDFPATHRR